MSSWVLFHTVENARPCTMKFKMLLLRLLCRALCRFEHIFDEDAVTGGGVIYQNMGV